MFVSYAQNFEDVMLWRALKHVERGFYVDIGANDPVVDSVSKAFYDRGWRGVHVEPVAEYAQLLREARPDEEVVEKAVGAETGEMTLHVIPGTGLSSLIEESARSAVALRGYEHAEIVVPVITLDELLAPYCGARYSLAQDRRRGRGARCASRLEREARPALDHGSRGDCSEQPGRVP